MEGEGGVILTPPVTSDAKDEAKCDAAVTEADATRSKTEVRPKTVKCEDKDAYVRSAHTRAHAHTHTHILILSLHLVVCTSLVLWRSVWRLLLQPIECLVPRVGEGK